MTQILDCRIGSHNLLMLNTSFLLPKYPELKEQFEFARTDSEQIKIGLGVGLILKWYTLVKEVATMLKEDLARRK